MTFFQAKPTGIIVPRWDGLIRLFDFNEAGAKPSRERVLNKEFSWTTTALNSGVNEQGRFLGLNAGGYFYTSDVSHRPLITDQLTIGLIFRHVANGSFTSYIFGDQDTASAFTRNWSFGISSVGDLSCSINTGSITTVTIFGALAAGGVYCLIGVYNGIDIRLYLNGALRVTPTAKTGNVATASGNGLSFNYWSGEAWSRQEYGLAWIANRAWAESYVRHVSANWQHDLEGDDDEELMGLIADMAAAGGAANANYLPLLGVG